MLKADTENGKAVGILKWLLIIISALILLFIIVIFTKVKVFLYFYHNGDNDHLKLEFKAWFGLIKYKVDVPLVQLDDDSASIVVKEKTEAGPNSTVTSEDTKKVTAENILDSINDTKELLTHVVAFYRIARSFLKKVTIRELSWHTMIGAGDASLTGMLTGAFWAAKGSMLGVLSHYMRLKAIPDITITPHFQFAVSQTAISCMIQFRIGHAMLAGIKLIKYWKGGMPNFRTKPLSILSNDKSKTV